MLNENQPGHHHRSGYGGALSLLARVWLGRAHGCWLAALKLSLPVPEICAKAKWWGQNKALLSRGM